MAFPAEATVTPMAIGDIGVELFDPNPLGVETQAASVSIQVLMSDGSVRVRKFNLLNHYTAQQINSLGAIDLVAAVCTKAETEILPAAN